MKIAKIPHAFTLKLKTQTRTNDAQALGFCYVPLIAPLVIAPPRRRGRQPPQGGYQDDDVDVDGVSQIYFEENKKSI